ncbi:hypothetical protein [Ornithinimicrobium flavum]|uniref:hypothetical protein n=1 Tax=Ornithinimicrobium flavum TaxID=1288636 RepID=UPI00106F63C6|nr:hypothetical protein [Ornithinimicrobium flavum]
MSETRTGHEDEHDPHDAPMLVLGEDVEDVEDTTAEELARQRQELEEQRSRMEQEARRRREEAEAEAARLRREAEEKLARERRETEIELARRQREIDDAERELERRRRRLQKETGRTAHVEVRPTRRSGRKDRESDGNSLLAAVDRRSGTPVPRLGRAGALAALAAALVALGAPLSIDPPPPEAVQEFVAQDEARIAWADTGLALDRDVLAYLDGEDVTVDGQVPSVARAEALTDGDDYYLDPFVQGVGPLLEAPGSTPQRVLSAWTEARDAARYSVSSYDVDRAAEALDTDSAFPTWMLLGAVVSTGVLGYGLLRGGSRVGAGLAGLALVPTVMLLVDGDRHLDVEDPIARHEVAMEGSESLHRQLGQDLQVVLGTRTIESYQRDTYWEESGWLNDVSPDVLEVYAAARAPLQAVDLRNLPLEESVPHAETLVQAGEQALQAQHELVARARTEVVAGTVSDLDLGRYVPTALAAGLLPLLALIPAIVRRQKVAG